MPGRRIRTGQGAAGPAKGAKTAYPLAFAGPRGRTMTPADRCATLDRASPYNLAYPASAFHADASKPQPVAAEKRATRRAHMTE